MKKLVLMLSLCLGVFFSCNTEEIASNGDNEVQELNIQLQDYVQTSGQNRSYEPPVCDCPLGLTCEIFEITYEPTMSLGQIAQLRQFYLDTLLCGVCMWTTQPFRSVYGLLDRHFSGLHRWICRCRSNGK